MAKKHLRQYFMHVAYNSLESRSSMTEDDDSRLEIIKSMLTEFSELREEIRKWLEETEFTD